MKKITLILLIFVFTGLNSFSQSKFVIRERDDSWLNKDYSIELFEILGMLDEYIGRRLNTTTLSPKTFSPLEITDFVESFYPHESDKANYFLNLVKQFEKKNNIDFNVRTEVKQQGHTVFHSDSLAKFINSFYIYVGSDKGTLYPYFINKQSRKNKIAYLRGAYRRHGREDMITIANGYNKMRLLESVLMHLGYNNVKTTFTKDCIPNSFKVSCDNLKYCLSDNREEYEQSLPKVDLSKIKISCKRNQDLDDFITFFYQNTAWNSYHPFFKPEEVPDEKYKNMDWKIFIPVYTVNEDADIKKAKNCLDLLKEDKMLFETFNYYERKPFIKIERVRKNIHKSDLIGTRYDMPYTFNFTNAKRFQEIDNYIISNYKDHKIIKVDYNAYGVIKKGKLEIIEPKFDRVERKWKMVNYNNEESFKYLEKLIEKRKKIKNRFNKAFQ